MNIYLELFLVFFKIGTFTFGGGYAMIPLIEKEIIVSKKWVEKEELMNLFSLAQSIPGAIAINSASIIGYKIAKKPGAFFATFGVILPSFIIISFIAMFFDNIADMPVVTAIFQGISGCVIALILVTALKMAKVSIVDWISLILFLVSIIFVLLTPITPIYVIMLGIIVGLLVPFEKKEASR